MNRSPSNEVFIIIGPTASGKSDFAIDYALKNNGVIINSDAFQVYDEIRICNASPSEKDKSTVEHMLYNYVSIFDDYSVSKWINDSKNAIESVINKGKLPILVGGSAMYVYLLINGIDEMPDISDEIRDNTKLLFECLGKQDFYSLISEISSKVQESIKPSDSQRMMRFYDVYQATGKCIWDFHSEQKNKFALKNQYNLKIHKILPAREILYQRCNERILHFIENGAIEEVQKIMDKWEKINSSAKKTILVPEIAMFLRGEISLDNATAKAQQSTRNYAKRQYTWFRSKF